MESNAFHSGKGKAEMQEKEGVPPGPSISEIDALHFILAPGTWDCCCELVLSGGRQCHECLCCDRHIRPTLCPNCSFLF
jgi:hypothetical protein